MNIERYLLYKKRANGAYSQVKPKQEREGKILFDNDPDADNPHMYKPVVCVKYRNNWCWRDIDDLPASKWNTYKTNITTNMENLLRKLRTESNSHNVTKKKLKSKKYLPPPAASRVAPNKTNKKIKLTDTLMGMPNIASPPNQWYPTNLVKDNP